MTSLKGQVAERKFLPWPEINHELLFLAAVFLLAIFYKEFH